MVRFSVTIHCHHPIRLLAIVTGSTVITYKFCRSSNLDLYHWQADRHVLTNCLDTFTLFTISPALQVQLDLSFFISSCLNPKVGFPNRPSPLNPFSMAGFRFNRFQ
jgi:hypothetical protein